MRKEFVEVKSRREAKKLMPWASFICKAEAGYWGFESADDYRMWKAKN